MEYPALTFHRFLQKQPGVANSIFHLTDYLLLSDVLDVHKDMTLLSW